MNMQMSTCDHHNLNGASRYNLCTHDKKFDVGEQVLILTPDLTSSRLWSWWRAPATVVEIRSPHSYLVQFDGARQHVHANKLRKCDVRVDEVVCNSLTVSDASVHSCSVIFDHDTILVTSKNLFRRVLVLMMLIAFYCVVSKLM
jgi:hypothetical protein